MIIMQPEALTPASNSDFVKVPYRSCNEQLCCASLPVSTFHTDRRFGLIGYRAELFGNHDFPRLHPHSLNGSGAT
jgi:hypothetical protein